MNQFLVIVQEMWVTMRMLLFSGIPQFLIFIWIGFLSLFIVGKILTQDGKLRLKETLYLILVSLFCAMLRVIPDVTHVISPVSFPLYSFFVFFVRTLVVFFLFVYLYKLKSYPIKKAIILTIFSDLLIFIGPLLTDFVFQSLLGIYQPYFDFTEAWLHILRILLSFVLSATIAFLVVKVSKKLRKAINVNAHLQAVFTFASLASWLIFQIVYFAQRIIVGMEIDIWMRILLVGYVVVTLIGFFFYAKHLKSKYVLQQKEDEQKNLLFYMDEIEQQQFAIRKFKHDQQNLFSALDVFVQEKDWDGLLQFYPKVKASSESITKNEFNLEGLANIKVREVKSIFTAKLAMAQHLKLEVKFEAGEEIDEIMGDSVTLVRMFGIILDNAIEELQSLGTGQLLVGCFKVEGSVNVVVQNTCRSDIPPLRQLQQTGYSSKGEGRGLGLSNLYELTNALPNVVLLTNIESGYFTQTLIIGGRV